MIVAESVGKRAILFPTVFFILFALPCTLMCQDFRENLYKLFSFPAQKIITFSDLNRKRPELVGKYTYHDLYRKKVNGDPVLAVFEEQGSVYGYVPFRREDIIQAVSFRASFNKLHFANEKDRTSVAVSFVSKGMDMSLRWAATKGVGLVGAGVDLVFNKANMESSVRSFPVSDNSSMNKYFLDWLEPTFGQKQDGKVLTKKAGFSFWGSTSLNDFQRLSLSVSHLLSNDGIQINYVNTTNSEKLAGKRELDVPVDCRETIVNLSLDSPLSIINVIEAGIMIKKISFSSDNNRPHFTDFETLGEGELRNFCFFTKYGMERNWYKLWFGLAAASYSSDFELNTPVLGLYGGLLPIAHSAKGKLSRDSSFSQQLGCDFSFIIGKTKSRLSSSCTHSRFWLRLQGDAKLEFGLISTPINYPIYIDATLLDFSYQLEVRMSKFSVYYSVQQMVPIFKRLDDSPFRTREEIPDVRVAERGGQFHEFSISVPF